MRQNKTTKPKLEKNSFFGDDVAAPFIRLLNSGEQLPGELTDKIARIRATRDRQVRNLRIAKVNAFLTNYKFCPVVEDVNSSGGVNIGWGPMSLDPGKLHQTNLVQMWIELAEQGLLGKIKQCANQKCQKWFFARFPHQLCHSVKCRNEAAKQDTARREARRAYERKYYHDRLTKGAKR